MCPLAHQGGKVILETYDPERAVPQSTTIGSGIKQPIEKARISGLSGGYCNIVFPHPSRGSAIHNFCIWSAEQATCPRY